MCGIAGLLMRDRCPVPAETVRHMTQVLAHRGPDGEGVHIDGPIGLGHRRLAILDLSDAGAQPMASDDGSLWITYNGELYNFQDLRTELEAAGARFRSRTDTEVILAAYRRWGRDCLARFNGMFAFGLWDNREQLLWLVRDRLGVKPLFYAAPPGRIAFASEIKGVLPALEGRARLNEEALHHFLTLNYTPAPLTLLEGIHQLPPGHELLCRTGSEPVLRRYWRLPADDAPPPTERELASLLGDAVRLRLISDVEVGAFLSGGIDSTAVVGWMSRHGARQLRTFTAVFQEATYNEGPAARLAASALGTRHHEQPVTAEDLSALPEIVWHSEELTADSSMLAVYKLAERARRDVKVVLTGDGADELFGGYPTYLATRVARVYRRMPWPVRACLTAAVERLPVSTRKASFESKLRRFVHADIHDDAAAHVAWRTVFNDAQQHRLLQTRNHWPATATLFEPFLREAPGRDLVDRLLAADLLFYLPNDMLVKVDRMTMAWGLEARTPYLDYRLVEALGRLPASVRCGGGLRNKALLRRLTRGVVPEPIRRRRKAGFNVPATLWLGREGRGLLERHLLDVRCGMHQIIRRDEIELLVREHVRGRADHGHQLWGLLCLSLWWQQFLEHRA